MLASRTVSPVWRSVASDSSVLDFLRATAVCLVLADHFVEATRNSNEWWFAERLGWMGVMLFFVHTSLVLMGSLERSHTGGIPLLKQFYVRRAFRIYPLSIVVVLAVIAFHLPVAAWYFQPAVASVQTAVANVLLVQNLVYAPSVLGPLWSLPLEVQMYVLLPFLYWLVRKGTRWDVALVLWFVSIVLAVVQPLVTDRANVLQYAPCFMAGVIAYCLSKRVSAGWPFWMWVLTLAAVLYAFVAVTANQANAHLMLASWGLTVTVGWLIPRFRETSSWLLQRTCSTIARYSYGLYLTHMIALWVAFVVLGRSSLVIRTVAGSSLTVLLPAFAYHVIEAPGIRFGSYLARRLVNRALLPRPLACAEGPR